MIIFHFEVSNIKKFKVMPRPPVNSKGREGFEWGKKTPIYFYGIDRLFPALIVKGSRDDKYVIDICLKC